ncbi:GtrA family protein [Hwanghaeella sp.]|uniref:GtrA family protein n=1 Tax=Hwanghaeella sp. TaxID=2605943 RepID=UPI003CCB74D2
MTNLLVEAQRFSKYGIIGLINNAALYALFVVVVYLGISPVAAAGTCYVLGVIISYLLNRRWAFGSSNSHSHDFPRFILAYGVGLVSTLATISVLLIWLPPQVAQILNVGITACVIYGMLRLVSFGIEKDHAN